MAKIKKAKRMPVGNPVSKVRQMKQFKPVIIKGKKKPAPPLNLEYDDLY